MMTRLLENPRIDCLLIEVRERDALNDDLLAWRGQRYPVHIDAMNTDQRTERMEAMLDLVEAIFQSDWRIEDLVGKE
jgi:hypothetical protein